MNKSYKLQITSNTFEKGFTLIELMVVISIIGILTSLGIVNFNLAQQKARDAQRKADLRQIQSALELYRADNGSYPIVWSPPWTLNAAACPTSSSFTGAGGVVYLQKIPCDPSNSDTYWWLGKNYEYISQNGTQYGLYACLENPNDRDGVAAHPAAKCASGKWLYFTQP